MEILVACYAGYRGEETPRCFWLGDRKVDIVKIMDRWTGPDHRYFKIQGEDQALYILRHDPAAWSWEITFFQDSTCRKAFECRPDGIIDEQYRRRDKTASIH